MLLSRGGTDRLRVRVARDAVMHPLNDLRRGRRHRDLCRLGYGPFLLRSFFPETGVHGGEWWSVLWFSPEGVL